MTVLISSFVCLAEHHSELIPWLVLCYVNAGVPVNFPCVFASVCWIVNELNHGFESQFSDLLLPDDAFHEVADSRLVFLGQFVYFLA